ncbi:hypothetical protein BJY04DRAFT_219282 [Aspergillus karnatakaensis]|uniref:uncharacterized protein n=1 Tax=Aspergillus karnatakaensis TaxID=1810916 RepID=UPI003CCC99D9
MTAAQNNLHTLTSAHPKRRMKTLLDPRNILGFLWLGPALTILILNFNGHIIGPGLNVSNRCTINPYGFEGAGLESDNEAKNCDALGALQFVAKVIEVWFVYVAISFMYNLTAHLYTKDNKVSVQLLLVYTQFTDALYSLALPFRMRNGRQKRQDPRVLLQHPSKLSDRLLICSLIFAAIFMCLLCNFMGVATTILLSPSLQWVDINQQGPVAFGKMLSSEPPRAANLIMGCSESDLASRAYQCAASFYKADFIQLIESASRLLAERLGLIPGFRENDILLQGEATNELYSTPKEFYLDSQSIHWSPIRHVSPHLSSMVQGFFEATDDFEHGNSSEKPDSSHFCKSLQVQLKLTGPVIGQIRCYEGMPAAGEERVTKCIRWGSGHDYHDVVVSVYTTSSARYIYNTTCFDDETCNWDQIFADPGDPYFLGFNGSQQTFEYSSPGYSPGWGLWCDSAAFLNFATYEMDPFNFALSRSNVHLRLHRSWPRTDNAYRNRDAAIPIHADWTLAPGRSMPRVPRPQCPARADPVSTLSQATKRVYVAMQAAFLIPYTNKTLLTGSDRRIERQRERENPYTAGTLESWASIQLWKYGFDGSALKKLGAINIVAGMLIVLATTLLWIEAPKSPTNVVISALYEPAPKVGKGDQEDGGPLIVIWSPRQSDRKSKFSFCHTDSSLPPSAAISGLSKDRKETANVFDAAAASTV